MTYNYNKARYLELLKRRPKYGDSDYFELLGYSSLLGEHIEWEFRDQYLKLMEDFLKDKISDADLMTEFQTIKYSVIDIVPLLESHRILLSVDKRASKFMELMEPIIEELDGDATYTGEEFTKFIQENFMKIKKYLDDE